MDDFRSDLELAGRAYQDLFSGADTDEGEAAGRHLAQCVHLITDYLTHR